jgi:hypothetical protein
MSTADFFNKDLINSVLGENTYVRELGVLAKAGTPFKINNSLLIMGPTERYELDGLIIETLEFPLEGNELNTYIIVDMIYEREE